MKPFESIEPEVLPDGAGECPKCGNREAHFDDQKCGFESKPSNHALARKLTTGFYQPTDSFKSIHEHFAVMNEDDQGLVAVVGAVDDDLENVKESFQYARLFAASPDLLKALTEIDSVFQNILTNKAYSKADKAVTRRLSSIARAAIAKTEVKP
jgi:hypothetical protein